MMTKKERTLYDVGYSDGVHAALNLARSAKIKPPFMKALRTLISKGTGQINRAHAIIEEYK